MPKDKTNPDLLTIQIEEAHQLCSTFQWMVVETSFSEKIETLNAVRLKSNIMSVKKFQQSARKGRAAQLFVETLDRFTGRLRRLENPDLPEQTKPDKQGFLMHAVEKSGPQDTRDSKNR